MHSALAVANRLLKLAHEKGNRLTPLQLMKLVFLCHAWMMGLHKKHLVKDPIEAWKYGPVIKELYDSIKEFKSNPVPYPLKDVNDAEFNATEDDLITQVYDAYGNFTGIQLSALTHEKGSPWDQAWTKGGTNPTISNDVIEHYYRSLADNSV